MTISYSPTLSVGSAKLPGRGFRSGTRYIRETAQGSAEICTIHQIQPVQIAGLCESEFPGNPNCLHMPRLATENGKNCTLISQCQQRPPKTQAWRPGLRAKGLPARWSPPRGSGASGAALPVGSWTRPRLWAWPPLRGSRTPGRSPRGGRAGRPAATGKAAIRRRGDESRDKKCYDWLTGNKLRPESPCVQHSMGVRRCQTSVIPWSRFLSPLRVLW